MLLLVSLLFGGTAMQLFAADQVEGYWLQTDQHSGRPERLVLVYEHGQKVYGRILVSFNRDGTIRDTWLSPRMRADALAGSPFSAGLDFIYELTPSQGHEWVGYLIDPGTGNEYDCHLWVDAQGRLVVRGQLKGFLGSLLGGEQHWPPYAPEAVPALSALIESGALVLPDPASILPVIHRKK